MADRPTIVDCVATGKKSDDVTVKQVLWSRDAD